MKSKLRKLVVSGHTYLWRFKSNYWLLASGSGRNEDSFLVYLEGHKSSPLRIFFAPQAIKRFTPKLASDLIQLALRGGWQPLTAQQPSEMSGRPLLQELGHLQEGSQS